MHWQKYVENFTQAAFDIGFDDAYVEKCLAYAERLIRNDLPVIFSAEHLSHLGGVDEAFLRHVAYSQSGFYRTYQIPKKNGSLREISEPLPNLKQIQQWLLANMLNKIPVSPFAKAFVAGRSIKENARFHRNQPMVLSLDVQNFFPSLTPVHVRNVFSSLGYSKPVTYYLTRLCTLNGGLPQGGPTSPALSNIIFSPLDRQIGQFCLERGVRYTRYADDLTFSGRFAAGELIQFLRSALNSLNLRLNESKTRLMRPHERQEVTGITVNKKMQAPRELRRRLRQAVHFIEIFGLDNHLYKTEEFRANHIRHLLGQATFILFINPTDRDAKHALGVLLQIHNLSSVGESYSAERRRIAN
jgi:RNA-directed DNA polymerase